MAKKIRRSLFIGLGGTGMRTILYLKKLFIETYGKVPGMIQFLGIDTDNGEFTKSLDLSGVADMGNVSDKSLYVQGYNKSKSVTLEHSEQIKITVSNPEAIFEKQRKNFLCIPEKNIFALSALTHDGAGQVRTNGRFACVCNTNYIGDKISTALTNVKNASTLTDEFELIDNTTDIYVIFSLGGGTGCGTFLDMAYIIRDKIDKKDKIAAVAVLPEVFKAYKETNMERVRPNAYGALKDLDWLMGLTYDSTPITLPLQNGNRRTTKQRPFDACFVIDNQNRNFDVYKEPSQIEEMLALMLITSVGELSTANASVVCNMAIAIADGSYDIEGKHAWASGVGCCEVLIRSIDLRKMYSHFATQNLINILTNRPVDGVQNEIENWINSPEVKIKEHKADDLTDYFIDLNELYPMSSIDKGSIENVYDIALEYVKSQQRNISEKLATKQKDVEASLHAMIVSIINRGDCAIGAAIDFISGLKSEIQVYKQEMIDEIEEQENLDTQTDSALKDACNELKEKNSSYNPFKKLDSYKQNVCELASRLARIKCEIRRKEAAKDLYSKLLAKISKYEEDIMNFEKNLNSIKKDETSNIALLKQRIESEGHMFQINLTSYVLEEMKIDIDEISSRNFINNLNGDKLFDLITCDNAKIAEHIANYTYNLKSAKRYESMDINDVLSSFDSKTLKMILNQMIQKSSPLLPHDYLGYDTSTPSINYYLGVNDYHNSVLYKGDFFKKNINPENVGDIDFSNIGMKDRVIIFSQMAPIPAFAINSVSNRCKQEYEDPKKQNVCYHFDSHIFEEMKRVGFSLEPCDASSALELWIKGLIFGFVKREDGKYYYKDKINGKPLENHWVELKGERNDAFRDFSDRINFIEVQFKEGIEELISNHGRPYVEEKFKKAKTGYISEFSQLEYSVKELIEDGHLKEIRKLVEEEMDYIEKNF